MLIKVRISNNIDWMCIWLSTLGRVLDDQENHICEGYRKI